MNSKNILVVDEQRFGKICSALVELNGLHAEWVSGCEEEFLEWNFECYDLVITSYPYGKEILPRLIGRNVALLVLSDFACESLIQAVDENANFFCLAKPVDFSRFNHVVDNLVADQVLR